MSISKPLVIFLALCLLLTGCLEKTGIPPVATADESSSRSVLQREAPPPSVVIPDNGAGGAEPDTIDPIEEATKVALPEVTDPSAPETESSAASSAKESSVSAAAPSRPAQPVPTRQTDDTSVLSSESEAGLPSAAASASAVRARGTRIEQELFRLINTERSHNGLPALELEDAMQFAAQTRAQEALDSLSHTRPNGTPYHTAFDEAGFSYAGKWHGENLALIKVNGDNYYEADVAGALFAEWKSSPGHHQNMLGENFFCTGVGVYIQKVDDSVVIGSAQLFAGR